MNTSPGRMDRFERSVVFRTARGYFFLMAVVAVLLFLGGVVVGAKGLVKVPVAEPPPPAPVAPVPPPPPLSREAVEKWMAEAEARRRAIAEDPGRALPLYRDETRAEPGATPSRRDARREEIERLFGQLAAIFPAPTYTWENVYREVCVAPSAFGCLRTERQLTTAGVQEAISKLLRERSRDESLEILRLWVEVLPQVPVEARITWLGPIIDAWRDLNASHESRVAEREAEVARRQAEYESARREWQDEVAAQEVRRRQEQTWGVYGVAGGLALLVLVSVFLVHFAIERHLRLLREMGEALRRPDAAPGGPADLARSA